jgi:hypothetical protein
MVRRPGEVIDGLAKKVVALVNDEAANALTIVERGIAMTREGSILFDGELQRLASRATMKNAEGVVLQHMGDTEKAYAAFREAVDTLSDPDVSPYAAPSTAPGAMLNLSSALVSIGRPEFAMQSVRACLEELQQSGSLLDSLCEPSLRKARLQRPRPNGIGEEVEECREGAVCLPREQTAMVAVAWRYLSEASTLPSTLPGR